ncbi:von Willebrand factor C and EGF domain-containing protein [Pelodytes ibericus]
MCTMVPFWMGVSCLLLLVSGRDGRVYNGRKKSPSLTAPRHRSGPHICFPGMGAGCCPGWTVSPGTGQCIQPLCSYGCGSGYCIAPNLCSCRDGHQGVTCTDDFVIEHEKDLEAKGLSLNCLSARCDQGCRFVSGVPICSCFHGYTLGKDGKTCYDVDECSRPQGSTLCQQQCKNIIGSYRCLCYYGYQISLNGRVCVPNKHPNNIAAPSPCGEYGCDLKCNDGGCEHVSRVCPVGFRMIETATGVTCTDINECASASCMGTCINTEGGFVCDCGTGLKLSADGRSCYDIDECSAHRSPCQQRCKNLHGSYRCLCGIGYILQSNGHTCADINECRQPATSHLCQHSCHNTHGSFFCSCQTGFQIAPNKVSCIDVDECLENHSLCPSGTCNNTLGSYFCSCLSGFQLSDGVCTAISVEMQTAGHPQPTEAADDAWEPLKPTSVAPLSSGIPGITVPMPAPTTVAQELVTTTPTSALLGTMTGLDLLQPPQHLRTGHSPLAQKASGISHMSLKEDVMMQPGTTIPQPTNVPCWHNKEIRQNGNSWTEPGCIDCTCQEGTVSCDRRVCSPNCSHPVWRLDSCCPSCDGCHFEEINRADGELFPNSPDNCTICICLVGNVTCIPPVCPPVTCTDPYLSDCCLRCPDGCEFQGQVYPHGAKFSQDDGGCTVCLCQNGSLECSFVPCPSLDCPREDWVLEAGQCCFKCQEPPQKTGCPFDDNGIEIPIGQIWSPGDPCAICICQADSSIVCKKTDCLETCPHPITVPGQCCPDCSAGCSYGRRTFVNNESFPSTTDPCLTCICLMGTVACSPIECAFSCTYPFHDEGECCPVCRDCTYDGRKVLNGQTFSLESDHCTQCRCESGEVQCEEVLCSISCTHPYIFPGECCSTCEECTIEGHILENGGSYIQKVDPCIVCQCSGGNMHCEQKQGPCTPCEQKTQDCLSELPDTFQTKQLQLPTLGTVSREVNMPLKVMNPSESRRLSHFQETSSRRDTEMTATPSAPFITEAPFELATALADISLTETHLFRHSTASTHIHRSYAQPSHPPQSGSQTRISVSPESSYSVSLEGFKPPHLLTSPTVNSKVIPPSGTTDHSTSLESHSTPRLIPRTNSFPNIVAKEIFHPYSNSYSTSAVRTKPPTAHDSISAEHFPSSSDPATSLHLRDFSLKSETTTLSVVTKYSSGPTQAPSRYTGHTQTPTRITQLTGTSLTQVKNEMKNRDRESGHSKGRRADVCLSSFLVGCSLDGHTVTNSSIFVADIDYCLQCECLRGEVYCRAETYFPNGLCCQDCSYPPIISCTRESNQIHSERDEGDAFCKCKKVMLHCQSCSSHTRCNNEKTSQSSESEQVDEKYIHWVPLVVGEGLHFRDVNPSP